MRRVETDDVCFAEIDWAGRRVRIEYQWVSRQLLQAPLLIFLHEGLGSLSMWRDFPQRLCEAAGCRGLVYSRPGYGASTPRHDGEIWLTMLGAFDALVHAFSAS